jgi:hypothetical protein
MKPSCKVRVYKVPPLGVFVWECNSESCHAPEDYARSGASIHWEIANHDAHEHAANWHFTPKHLGRDLETPPGGAHFDWTDTGHIRKVTIPNQRYGD